MQSCCFGIEQHLGHWAVFSAAFHHAERAPRVISSLTAESPTIRSFKHLWCRQGFLPPVSCAQGSLVNCATRANQELEICWNLKNGQERIGKFVGEWFTLDNTAEMAGI